VPGIGDAINRNFYIFDLGGPKISWVSLTAEKLGTPDTPNPKSPAPSPTPSPSPNTSKSPVSASQSSIYSTSPNVKTSDQQSSNQPVIIGLSVGLGTLGIASAVAFTLIYRRMKKKNTMEELEYSDSTILQIPSSNDKRHPTYVVNQYPDYPVKQYQYPNQQQYPPAIKQSPTPPMPQYHLYNPDYSPTPTFIQPQGYYSPVQEFSLPPPQKSFSDPNPSPGSETNYSSGNKTNYFPGSETDHSSGNKTNFSPGSETNYSSGDYSPGSESPPPPPPPKG
jgi:hypothetical protein